MGIFSKTLSGADILLMSERIWMKNKYMEQRSLIHKHILILLLDIPDNCRMISCLLLQ